MCYAVRYAGEVQQEQPWLRGAAGQPGAGYTAAAGKRSPRKKRMDSLVRDTYKAQVTGHKSKVTGHRLQVTGHRLQVTDYRSQVTDYRSQITGHRLQVTGHTTWLTCVHLSLAGGNFDILLKQILYITKTPEYFRQKIKGFHQLVLHIFYFIIRLLQIVKILLFSQEKAEPTC